MILSLRKKALGICALLSVGSSMLGFSWTIKNATDKILMISVKLVGSPNARFWHLASPNKSVTFDWSNVAVNCFSALQITEYDPMDAVYQTKNAQMKTLKTDVAYGDNSPDYVKNYFDKRVWRSPKLIEKSGLFLEQQLESISNDTDAAVKIAQKSGKTGVAGYESGLAAVLSTKVFAEIEDVTARSSCKNASFEIHAAKILNPATGKKDNAYICIRSE